MTTAAWEKRLKAADILSSPVNDYGAWLDAPQVVATMAAPAITVTGPGAERGAQVHIPRTPGQPLYEAPAPQLGQHSRTILAEIGFSVTEIGAMMAAGTVASPSRGEEDAP